MTAAVISAIRALKHLDEQAVSEIVAALSSQFAACPNAHIQARKNAIEMLDDVYDYLTDEIAADAAYAALQTEEDERCMRRAA